MIELPTRDPCDLCVAGGEESWKIIDESDQTLTVINPWQFEVGQCCVITRRYVATLLELPTGSALPSRPGESRRRSSGRTDPSEY